MLSLLYKFTSAALLELQGFSIRVNILWGRAGYLVNKPLSEAGILVDNAQGWKVVQTEEHSFEGYCEFWGQSFSRRHYPPIYQQVGKGFIYFITFRLISQDKRTYIVPAYFVDFFVFLDTELSTSFLIFPSLASAKRFFVLFCFFVFCFPWPIKRSAWTVARFLVPLPSK